MAGNNDHLNYSQTEYNTILMSAKIGLWAIELIDGHETSLYCNMEMEELIGVSHGTSPEDAYVAFQAGMLPEYQEALDNYLNEIATAGRSEIMYKWQYPDGHIITVRCVGVLDKSFKKGTRLKGFHQDITQTVDLQERNKELIYEVEHDNQTGLLCRSAAEMRIKEALENAEERKALLLIDIDNLSKLNERFGHAYGDKVIVETANILKSIHEERENDIVGRYNGDGFIVLVNGIAGADALVKHIEKLKKLIPQISIEGVEHVSPTCSIGISFTENDAISFADLYRQADIALYHAKNKGVNYYAIYTKDMTEFRLNEHVKQLEESNSALREQLEIVGAMAKVSFNTFLMDLKSNTIMLLKQGQAADEFESYSSCLDVSLQKFIDKLDEETGKNMSEMLGNAEKITKLVMQEDTYAFEYIGTTGIWTRAHIVVVNRNEKGEPVKALWIMENIDKEKKQEMTIREAEKERNNLFRTLACVAYTIYQCNTVTGEAVMVHGDAESKAKWPVNTTITKISESVLRDMVGDVQENREKNRDIFDLQSISRQLTLNDIISHDINTESMGWIRVNIIAYKRDEQGNVTESLFMYLKVDDKKRVELETAKIKAEQAAILACIANTYNFMYRMDLVNGLCYEIYTPEYLKGKIPPICKISEAKKIWESLDCDAEAATQNSDFLNPLNWRGLFTGGNFVTRDLKLKMYGWARLALSPLKRDESGNVTEVLWFARHIGKEKEQELATKRMEQERATLLKSLSKVYSSIFHFNLINGNGTEIQGNNVGFEHIPTQLTIKNALKMFESFDITLGNPEAKHDFWDYDSIIRRLRDTDIITKEVLTKDQGWVQFYAIVYHRDEKGNAEEILCLSSNIDEHKKRELEMTMALETAYEEARQANSAKSRFLSAMSHDIRTPMNAIMGMVEIAKRNEADEKKVRDSIRKIESAGKQLISLVNDILDISEIESGRFVLRPSEGSVMAHAESFETLFQTQVEQKHISFDFNTHDIIYPWLMIDELRFNQICTNLISNAIKYTPDGGSVSVEMYEKSEDEKAYLSVVVSDTGIGMSKDFMDHMWETFSRAFDSRINKIQGTGLGLSIVRQLVGIMGGTIDVESELNKGSKFTVVLPVEPIDHVEEEETFTCENGDVQPYHVLVAEDNDINWEIAEDLLKSYGIIAKRAENGEVCMKLFTEAEPHTYDAILMDMQMPIMNGIEATKAIRASEHAEAKTIPIIAMTANAFAEDVAQCKEAGMNDHISKPIDIKIVVSKIRKYAE